MASKRRIAGVLGYGLFLLLFAELALQVFYRVTAGDYLFGRAAVPIWAPNEWSGIFNKPHLAYRHSTHEFEAMNYTNGQGLRVPQGRGDYPLEPPADATRILLLGPSFAFGWGVDYEATFGHRLERLLQAGGFGGRRRVELVNAGVNSLPPAAHLNWFRHAGRDFHPALVIQFVYGSMAVSSDPASSTSVTPEGFLVRREASLGDRMTATLKKSALVFYGWLLYAELDRATSRDEPGEVVGAGRTMQTGLVFDPEQAVVADALAFYRSLRDEVRRAGAEALIVHFPLSYAVHPEDASRWRHLGIRDVEAQTAFDRAFCDHLRTREGLPCLDIGESLRRAAARDEGRLYYWLDVHWTEAGNRVAAEAVAAYLLDRGPDA